MAEEHAPSYYLEEGPELVGEDHWNFLGTDDFGADVAYDEDFDFGADENLANVEDTDPKDPDPKATNEMSEEQPPSFYVEPGLELVGEDHWDFLGINGFDPNVAYDEDFDFGTDENPTNVEPTTSKGPDPKAIDREGTQEVVGVAREDEVSQDDGSSQVVMEPTSNDVDKAIPEESVGAHEDISQPARDSERSPVVTAPTVTVSKGPSQPDSCPIVASQPSKDNRQKPKADTPSVESVYNSAVIPQDTLHGTKIPAQQHLDRNPREKAVSPETSLSHGRLQDSQLDSGTQSRVDKDQFWKDQEEIFSSLNNPGNNNEMHFPFDFSNDDWSKYADQVANEDLPEMAGTGVQDDQRITDPLENEKHIAGGDHAQKYGSPMYHEPQSQENVDNSSEHTRPPIYSRQRLAAKTPALSSGSDTASVSRGHLQQPVPVRAYQSGNTVGRSGPSVVQGASRAMNPAAKPQVDDHHAAIDEAKSDDSDEEDEEDVPDEVAFKTFEENDPLIETPEDAPKKGWGRIGKRNGHEVWFNPKTSKWQPSASHHDMRATLIARAQAEYPDDTYLHPDPTDGLPHGETAFFKPHQFRGPNRDQCADELFVWREYKPKKDKNGKPLRRRKPVFTMRNHPGYMYEGDKILLDPHDNPVVNHKFIPLTLSIYTDGAKLQEMALRPGCRQADLWARMPRWEKKTYKNGKSEIIPLRDKNTRINMPMTRFREKKGTIAGGDREGTEVIMAGLAKFYSHHSFNIVASGNSVKGFERDLRPWEVKEVRLGNIARFAGRAGTRALDDEKREDNYRKTLKSIANGKKKQAAKNGGNAGKRNREDEVAGAEGSGPGPEKRRRRAQEVDVGSAAKEVHQAGHQEAPINEGGQNGYVLQGNPSRRQQNRTLEALPPPQIQVNAYGAPEAPYQQLKPQAQSQPMNNRSDISRGSSRVGTSSSLVPNGLQHARHGDVQPQLARSPYGNMPGQIPLNNNITNIEFHPGGQYPQSNTGMHRSPNFGPAESQQTPQGRNHFESVQRDRRDMAQYRNTSNISPTNHHPSHTSNNLYGPPVQQQEPLRRMNGAPQHGGNTLGPGGRSAYQAPKQVLGKRGQQVAGRDENYEDWRYATRQQQVDLQANSDPDAGSLHKRRRNNETPRSEPRQQRRPNGRVSRPQYYGAWGAPSLLIPPDNFFGDVQPTSEYNGNAERRLKPPEELFSELGDVFGGQGPTSTTIDSANQGSNDAPTRQSGNLQRTSRGYETQQVLGKHERRESHWDGNMYVPQQHTGEQSPEEHIHGREQNIDMPEQKRRRMPGTGGYYAPPVQAPRAEMVRKARMAERDAHLPMPQLNVDKPVLNYPHAPQVDVRDPTPQQHNYINKAPINVIQAPRVADAQGQDPPRLPQPVQAEQQAPCDIRNLRPVSAWESQSLHNALGYTREAYLMWTGEEAPVTNLEDCYNVQYRELRAAFQLWWSSRKNPRRLDPLPELWRMKPWSGIVEGWKAPDNGEHLLEPMKRGRWAPRNEDGRLRQQEFHWEAGKYDEYDPNVSGRL